MADSTIAPIQAGVTGRLTWNGSNLGFGTPIFIGVEDEAGVQHMLGLVEALERINQFQGYRGNQLVKENIIDCAFIAYEHGLMTDVERQAFEGFVRKKLDGVTSVDAARAVLRRR